MVKLYARDTARVAKVLITAQYAHVHVDVVTEFPAEVSNKVATGKLPILETEHGFISESHAIARYLARNNAPHLYGKTSFEAGLIDQFIDFTTEVELAAYAWLLPIQKVIQNNPAATKKAQEDIKKILRLLDNHLLTRTFLVGNSVTLADIVLGASLVQLYELVLDPSFRSEFVNTNRWFVTLVHQPEFSAVLGQVTLAEVAAAAPAKEKAHKEPKEPKKEKTQEPKKEKTKEPKKEEPKEEKTEEEDYEDDYGEKDDKKKNPLDALPKSATFQFDEWKRVYSNNDTRSVALPWFFEHFDKEGYSVFWCDYKYNAELEKIFMTSNLINGFFQRLEKLHKYAFGSMIIFGEEGNSQVSGVWVFRGLEVPADMLVCDDHVHYNWRQANLSDPAEKALFEDFLAWDGSFGGRPYNCGKVFK